MKATHGGARVISKRGYYRPGHVAWPLPPAPPPNPLTIGLVGYWKMDEVGGNYSDVVGGNHFVAQGIRNFDGGKINNAARWDAASAGYGVLNPCPAVLDFSGAQDFTIAFWYYPYTVNPLGAGNYRRILYHWDQAIIPPGVWDYRGFWVGLAVDPAVPFMVGSGDTAPTVHAFGVVLNAWNFILAYHDGTAKRIGISRNNGAPDTAAAPNGMIWPSGQAFYLTDHSGSHPQDGLLDELGIWNRLLTTDEKTELYNSGAGKSYPF